MTPLERAARAVKFQIVMDMPQAREAARAALMAIREPSEGMEVAFAKQLSWNLDSSAKAVAKNTWQAMIDAALEEK